MKPSRFTEEQIIGILREQGRLSDGRCLPQARDLERDLIQMEGYKWKGKYGGLEASDPKRLKTLQDENAKLKKLLAEAMLDNAMLKEVASKKWSHPPRGERPSLTCGALSKLANGGRVRRLRSIGPRSAIAATGLTTRRCGCGCANWRPCAAGSAIAACSS